MNGEVEVWVADRPEPILAGLLRPSMYGGGALASASFEYADEYIAGGGWSISPELPVRRGRQYTAENQTMFGALSDAAPDDWGQKIIRAERARRRRQKPELRARLGEFDYLLGVSDRTRMGALRIREAGGGSWLSSDPGAANVHDLDRVIDAARRYEDDEATDEDIAYLGEIATSPGGARPKANLVLGNGRLAIVKLPHSKDGDADTEAWEAVAFALAARAGIRTPVHRLLRVGESHSVLITERFDRDHEGGRRIGYMSARTLLELGTHDDGSRLTYEDLAAALGEVSPAPATDLRELFARVALTVMINNADDHWRNHGFLRGDDGWHLSPAFDINPSPRRTIQSRAISPDDDPRERDIRRLLGIADAFQLTKNQGERVLHEVAAAAREWDTVASDLGIGSAQRSRMAPAFDETQIGWALSLSPIPPPRAKGAAEPTGGIQVAQHVRNGVRNR